MGIFDAPKTTSNQNRFRTVEQAKPISSVWL
jgi:hypothetical protein